MRSRLHGLLPRAGLALASFALAACGAKVIRYDAGAFSLLVPKALVVEQFVSSQQTVFSLRLGQDGPVCATLQFTHQGGGACGPEELALQHGTAAHCDERGENCAACVDLDGSAAQLHARVIDELECSEVVRGIFESLQVKPALHR
jgi:hypothetical protein